MTRLRTSDPRPAWQAIALSLALTLLALAAPATAQRAIPGETPLDLNSALALFKQVCADRLPGFENSRPMLAAADYWQNPETGTQYHPTFNLSFNILPGRKTGRCSMVFASEVEAGTLAVGLSVVATATVKDGSGDVGVNPVTGTAEAAAAGGAMFYFEPTGVSGQNHYFHAVLTAGN